MLRRTIDQTTLCQNFKMEKRQIRKVSRTLKVKHRDRDSTPPPIQGHGVRDSNLMTYMTHHQVRGSILLVLLCLCSLFSLARTQSGGVSLNQECEGTLSDGTIEYFACSASSEALSQLDVTVAVDPVNSTCGFTTDTNRMIYSTLGYSVFSICDASNVTFAHPPELVIDSHNRDNPTWWQSISWYDYPFPLEVNLTLSLDHSYTLVDNLDITFESGRPKQMILEKSNDGGLTWEVLQYYSSDCLRDFSQADVRESNIENASQVICTSDDSGTLPYRDGQVVYSVQDRLALLFSDTLLPQDQVEAYENDTTFRELLTLTDLRLRLLYPATDGLEITNQMLSLIKYYYAISNIESYLTCNCNQHGRFCMADVSGSVVCECFHNTMGPNCETCLPLYNNKPWRAGTFTPYPSGTANECEKCICNDHADSCVYNATLEYGVCQDCYHNTAGHSCQICINGFHQNQTLPINDANICTECNCEPLGSINNSSICAQFANEQTGAPIGQCDCRVNVTGRACDQCVEGFYGLLVEPNLGTCSECGCNVLGTVNASVSCDQTSGQCSCKPNADTRVCGQCRDQFYRFPTDSEEDCLACRCDPGGSTSLTCHMVTGRCDCRGSVGGRQCLDVNSGYYYPFLDFNVYDAWEATSTCLHQSDFPRDQFSGLGYVVCGPSDTVTFSGVRASYENTTEMLNYVTLRYTYDSPSPWLMVAMTITTEATNDTALSCPEVPGSILGTSAFSLPPGTNVAWTSSAPFAFNTGCSYTVDIQLDSSGLGSDSILLDSVVLVPDPTPLTVYDIADSDQREFYDNCITNISSLSTKSQSLEACRPLTFSVMLEAFGEAQECSCDPTGSLQASCTTYGGSCLCKPGVGGQNCDRCSPGFFNFTSEGCQVCACEAAGSITQACDYVTGQCPCKAGVVLDGQTNHLGLPSNRRCSACQASFYGYGRADGCQACGCSELGSLDPQCSETGACRCLDTVGGAKCDSCLPGFFNLTGDGCSPCECDVAGSSTSVCNPTTGVCSCKANVQGTKCSRCSVGFFNLVERNPDGCQPCFCYGHGQTCNTAPNYLQDFVTTDFTLGGVSGWRSTDPSSFDVNPANIRVSHPPSLSAGSSVYIVAPWQFLGFKLSSYGRTLSYDVKLDIGSVDTTSVQYVVMSGGPQNTSIYYVAEEFAPAEAVTTFSATFYERLWRRTEDGADVSVQAFQEILADVTSLQIRASYGEGTVSTFYSVAMETATYSADPAENDIIVNTVEQCTCDISSNTMGLSCNECQRGTKRLTPFGPTTEVCVPCFCNGRASSCDPDSGVCIDCRPGTMGDICESCAANVQEPTCVSCVADHYGFGTDLFGGTCAACNCNSTGTAGATQCDNDSGQCPCIGNYGERQCDGCAYNYYDYQAGCLTCDVCYDGIETAHQRLLSLSQNLTTFVEMLEANDNSSIPTPFYERLQTTNTQLAQLVDVASVAVQDGADVEGTITSLNVVLDSLMLTLDGAVQDDITGAQENASRAEENAMAAAEAVDLISADITMAYEALTSGDFQAAQSALEGLVADLTAQSNTLEAIKSQTSDSVVSLERNVEEIRNTTDQTMAVASDTLQTAQNIQVIHDNTTARTAAEVLRSDQVQELGQATQEEVNELFTRAEQVDSDARQKLADVQASSAAVDVGAINAVIITAGQETVEAAQIEAEASSKQSSAQNTMNLVENAVLETQGQVSAVNATVTEVNGRRDRSAQANQEATDAVILSTETFEAAEEMLVVALNFENQVNEARSAAFTSLTEVDGINQEAVSNLAETSQLRAQLTPIQETARSGLDLANEALVLVETENQGVSPILDRAVQLQAESDRQLTDTADVVDSINQLNSDQLQPALESCDSYQPAIDGLEALVTEATDITQRCADGVGASQTRVNLLIETLQDINQVDTSQLADLQTRIEQTRELFSQRDYAAIVTSLQQSVDEQEAWLVDTRATIAELQAQIDGLESFNP